MKQPDEHMLALSIIAKILLHTIDNPIKSREIEQTYGITGEKVREIVHDARAAGHAIGSGGSGYFKCRTFAEWEPTRKHLRSRALKTLELIKPIDEQFKGEQQGIFGQS